MKKHLAIILAIAILMTSLVFIVSAETTKNFVEGITQENLKSQNAGATTVTTESGVVKFTTSGWDGLTFTCWTGSPNFGAAALPADQYLNIIFKYTGTGTTRLTLTFTEGTVLLADLVKDDYATITNKDGVNHFGEGEYEISIKLSDLGLTPTDGNLTTTGWIMNYTLGTVEFSKFEVSTEPLANGSGEGGDDIEYTVVNNLIDNVNADIVRSQNAGASTVTKDSGKITLVTSTWDGLTYSCWGAEANFTPIAISPDLYLKMSFKYTGTGTTRFTLTFNEGNPVLADLVKDDFATITNKDGVNHFGAGEYDFVIKLSDLGLTPTNGTLTMTGFIINSTLGDVELEEMAIVEVSEPTTSAPEEESEVESAPADESEVESEPADESIPAEESTPEESEPEAPTPIKLFVNAINDELNYSVSGKFNKLNTVAGTEGYAAIISDPAKFGTSYAWVNMAYFAPTDVAGVYEVIAIQQIAGEATAPLAFPEGGFVYITNTGNDWPALCKAYKEALEADPNTTMEKPWYYDQYKDYPNFQTPEVNASFSAIAGLEAGMKASLVNVNLSSSEIRDNFKSLIVVNDTTGGVLDFADIDLTNKELVEVEVDDYTYIDEPYGSWVEAEKGALIDGAIPGPGEAAAPGFQQKTEYAIDFAFKAPADIYAVEMYITQLIGWGIPAADAAHFYGTVDGENYFYLGTGYMPADAANEEGVIADATYAYRVDLDKCATGLTGIRVVLDQDNSISWVFASEFNAYTAQDVVVEEPETSEPEVSEPETSEEESKVTPPVTGDASLVIFALAMLVVLCGVVIFARRRNA